MRKILVNRLSVVLFISIHLITISCSVRTQQRLLTSPGGAATLDHNSKFLKAHLLDGQVVILRDWQVPAESRVVTGTGVRYDVNRLPVDSGTIQVSLDSVALFETNVSHVSASVAVLTLVTAASIGLTIFCIANPKSCFGSCPTFYADSPEGEILQAEGFSSSVLPTLEASDIDALYRVRASGTEFRMKVSNEALETHMIKQADLLLAPRETGRRVLYGTDKKFWSISDMVAPRAVVAESGEVTGEFAAFDGREYGSLTDSADLAIKEEITFTFPSTSAGRHGVQIACRQSFLSTFLFYQALAFMGTQAGETLARVVRAGPSVGAMVGGPGRVLGGIEVLLQDSAGSWQPVMSMHETGPLATDVHMLPLPEWADTVSQLKLRMTRGHWRIDQVQLVTLDKEVTPIRVAPSRLEQNSENAPDELALLRDSSAYLVTMPGDEYTLVYELPGEASTYEFFLQSRGYYLEWLRTEWLKEENPPMALMMFAQPERALKLLAPEFKKVEPVIEEMFWGSRYAPHQN